MAIADVPRGALSARAREEASDAELVDAVNAGDSAAFGELYERHYESVLRVCQRRAPGAADDIAQAAFLRALDNMHQCRGDKRFGGWVQTIALRLCTDHHRAAARIDCTEWDFDRLATSRPDAQPERELLAVEQRHHIAAALSALPDRQREVLHSRDVDERRPTEIAAALGLSVGAVDSVLMRARRRAAETYRALSADTGATSIGTTTTTAVTSAGALGHGHVLGAVSRLVNSVSGAARELAARIVASPFASVAASPRPGMSVAALAIAVGALTGGNGAEPSTTPSLPADLPPVEVTVPVPAGDVDLAVPVPDATVPAIPAAPTAPSAPSAPALPAQPAPPDASVVAPVGEASDVLMTTVETLVDDFSHHVESQVGILTEEILR